MIKQSKNNHKIFQQAKKAIGKLSKLSGAEIAVAATEVVNGAAEQRWVKGKFKGVSIIIDDADFGSSAVSVVLIDDIAIRVPLTAIDDIVIM